MSKIILIGGAPAIGKTTLAAKLSKNIGIPWISTDSIRRIMRIIAPKKDYPGLFYFTDKTPEIYLKDNSPEQVVADQNRESAEVWQGIKGFIESARDYDAQITLPYIIEGVAILPDLIHKDFPNSDFIKPIFLLNGDRKEIKKIIYSRGLWDEAKNYPDGVKDLEVEWALAFNKWLESEVRKYNYPAIEIGGKKDLVLEARKLLNL